MQHQQNNALKTMTKCIGTTLTPSNYPKAGLIKRLMSLMYDSLIIISISFLYIAIVTFISTAFLGNPAENYMPNAGGTWVQIGWLATLLSFYCFFWLRVGQTVAMKAWKLKLLTLSGEPLTLSVCIARCLLGSLSFLIFGLGYFWMLIDPEKLALHDRITRTQIVVLPKTE